MGLSLLHAGGRIVRPRGPVSFREPREGSGRITAKSLPRPFFYRNPRFDVDDITPPPAGRRRWRRDAGGSFPFFHVNRCPAPAQGLAAWPPTSRRDLQQEFFRAVHGVCAAGLARLLAGVGLHAFDLCAAFVAETGIVERVFQSPCGSRMISTEFGMKFHFRLRCVRALQMPGCWIASRLKEAARHQRQRVDRDLPGARRAAPMEDKAACRHLPRSVVVRGRCPQATGFTGFLFPK